MVVRLTAAAGALGVSRVLVSTDTFRVSAAVLRESRRRAEGRPPVEAAHRQARQGTSSAVVTAWWENWASRK